MRSVQVRLKEWEAREPEAGNPLEGLRLASRELRHVADELARSGKLEVLELARGLAIRASSWVGRIELGEISIVIEPKIVGAPLLNLLRYAYGLRHLDLFSAAEHTTAERAFQELLVQQLTAEVAEIMARGLHRDYRTVSEMLESPVGRIDFKAYTRTIGEVRAALPCIHHPRTESMFLNQVLLAGLRLASGIAMDLELRSRVRRLAQILEATMRPVRLDRAALQRAWRNIDRRTAAYGPALTLFELLLAGIGVSLDAQTAPLQLPGFLFDMNRFFQALLSRFLRDHLEDFEIRDEHSLRGMFSYDPVRNPRERRAPAPRPDFVVRQDRRVVAVLDAKYRDLWEKPLPRDMLYQLALYAIGHDGASKRSTILYPTVDPAASEQIIILHNPVRRSEAARIVLRPVNLLTFDSLLREPLRQSIRSSRRALARSLAFGPEDLGRQL